MSFIVTCAVKSAVILAVGLVACAALARASAAIRRAVLVAALTAAIAAPVVASVGPAWHVDAPAMLDAIAHESSLEGGTFGGDGSTVLAAPRATSSAMSAPASPIDLTRVLVGVWLVIAAALFARAIGSQVRARRLARTGTRVGLDGLDGLDGVDDLDVRISDDVDSPAVTGIVRATVLLPRAAESWSPQRMRMVLAHEVAHVRSRDGLAQLVADAACALHWFDPLVWLAAARLRVERELAADDAVLAIGVRASSYAEELLAVAGTSTAGALAMAERATLGDRVVAILAARRARGPVRPLAIALLVAGTIGIGAAIACAAPALASTKSPRVVATDPLAQRAADDVRAATAKSWAADAVEILVLDAATGDVLADAGHIGAIAPGSTLKPITIAAALETGAITPTQQFDCGPYPRSYGAQMLHDASPNGTLDAAHILAVSSNIGTSRIFDALGGDQLASWLARFHFATAPTAITSGSLEGAEIATGEAMTATPLEVAAAYAVFASDGIYHSPGETGPGERVVSSATAREVMAMLDTAVTDEHATGKRARIDGLHVAGKTGTADLGGQRTYASFVGIADLPTRRLVVLVGVDTRRPDASGGAAAAPAFAELVARLR